MARIQVFNPRYFESPHFLWWTIIVSPLLLLVYLGWIRSADTWSYADAHFGPLAFLFWRIVDQAIFGIAIVIHLFESLYALHIARSLTLQTYGKWFLQTLVLGGPSLAYLVRYRRFFQSPARKPVSKQS
eukprot:ANDGO_01014.mRNA.1 hypothetical protein CAOG_02937